MHERLRLERELSDLGVARKSTSAFPEPHSYAVFFTGGAYGRAAEAFIAEEDPTAHRIHAKTFEEMFKRLADDMARRERSGPIRVFEISLVSHANASGALVVPLIRGQGAKKQTIFTAENLALLQKELRAGKHKQLRDARRRVVARLDEDTQIIVRGCNFGESAEAVDALRIFFGGRAVTWASRGFQGYEVVPDGKSKTIARTFFIYDPDVAKEADQYLRYKQMSQAEKLGAASEPLKKRPLLPLPTLASTGPGLDGVWALSSPPPMGRDTQLDGLSQTDIEARARSLDKRDPQNQAMLKRLWWAWNRKSNALNVDTQNAFRDLATVFGDDNMIAPSGRYLPAYDLFEEETFTAATRSSAEQEAALRIDSPAATVARPDGAQSSGVEKLTDGLRLWGFGVDSSALRKTFTSALATLAPRLIASAGLRVQIEGHASRSSGTDAENLRLSSARAEAVRKSLVGLGVPATRIEVSARGAQSPLGTETGERSRAAARNRRVDVHIVSASSSNPQPVIDIDLRAVLDQAERLGNAGKAEPFDPRTKSQPDLLDKIGMGIGIVDLLNSLTLEVGLLEFLGPVGALLDIINTLNTIGGAIKDQRRAAKKLGIRLGLQVTRLIGYSRRRAKVSGSITASAIKNKILERSWDQGYAWRRQIQFGAPAGNVEPELESGVQAVANAVNAVIEWSHQELRKRLVATVPRATQTQIEDLYRKYLPAAEAKVVIAFCDHALSKSR
jgi:outer membrane protein OmpA-like peptidoglycan-associated protein